MVFGKLKKSFKKKQIILKAAALMMALLLVCTVSYSGDSYGYTASSTVPSAYASYISALKEIFPNATFEFDYIDEDFEDVVSAQEGIKKVSSSTASSWKALLSSNYDWDTGSWTYTEGGWTYASYEVIAYYMDPRNFLNESFVYMFLQQSYSSSETLAGVQTILSGTFMYDYASYVLSAAQETGVSAYVLAAIMVSEQGSTVTSLTSGTYSGYEGYYNFFNINATGSTTTAVIVNGLSYAKSQGWNTVYKSILGGAEFYANSYFDYGQDTYYYMHYNVINGSSNYWHQYATAVWAAYNSTSAISDVYENLTDAAFTFRIPVYNNMPSTVSAKPTQNSYLNNYYFTGLSSSSGTLSPSFTMYTTSYTLSVSSDTTITYSLPSGASYAGASSFSLSKGTNTVELKVKSQTGYTRTYTITVTASKACTLYVGTGTVTSTTLYGDANGDGKISSLDYVAVKNHILGTTTITDSELLELADANQDGKISSLDYVWIKNYILGN